MQITMSKSTAAPHLHSWDDVRVLLAVLRQGSFTAAARALGTDQSTVSRRIATLEEQLGCVLFERTRRAPVPTEAARRLLAPAEGVASEITRFSDAASDRDTSAAHGVVRLALTEGLAVHFVVPRVLSRLRAQHPNLRLELHTGYRAVDIAGGEADVALRFFRPQRGDLITQRIATLPLAVLASRRHAKAWKSRDATELPWVTVEIGAIPTPESLWRARFAPQAASVTCTSYEVQLAAIRAGLGVGLAPAILSELDNKLVRLPLSAPPPSSLDVFLVTRRGLRQVRRVAVVIDAISAAFAELARPTTVRKTAGPSSTRIGRGLQRKH